MDSYHVSRLIQYRKGQEIILGKYGKRNHEIVLGGQMTLTYNELVNCYLSLCFTLNSFTFQSITYWLCAKIYLIISWRCTQLTKWSSLSFLSPDKLMIHKGQIKLSRSKNNWTFPHGNALFNDKLQLLSAHKSIFIEDRLSVGNGRASWTQLNIWKIPNLLWRESRSSRACYILQISTIHNTL